MVNRNAQKYKVAYYPRINGELQIQYRYFNCVSKALKFARHYPSTVRIGHHYLNNEFETWCDFHRRLEHTV